MKNKCLWADDWDKRINKLADEGKLKILDDGFADIVEDKQERAFLQETRKKEKLQFNVDNPVTPVKLSERFD